MSPVKEPNYFSRSIIPDDYIFAPIRNEEQYLKLFSNVKDEKAIGEASAIYLQDEKAPFLIHKIIPNAKIIIMLRDPVERAFSHFNHYKSIGFENRTFRKALDENLKGIDKTSGKDYVGAGMFYDQVRRYVSTFGKNNVKIVLFDEFSKNTSNQVKEIFHFLNISSKLPKEIENIYNQYSYTRGKLSQSILKSTKITKISRELVPEQIRIKLREKVLFKKSDKPIIQEHDKNFLKQIYKNDLKKLSEFLNIELS